MDFQVKADVRIVLKKQLKKFFGTAGIEIERAVEHTDILDAVFVDGLKPLANGVHG